MAHVPFNNRVCSAPAGIHSLICSVVPGGAATCLGPGAADGRACCGAVRPHTAPARGVPRQRPAAEVVSRFSQVSDLALWHLCEARSLRTPQGCRDTRTACTWCTWPATSSHAACIRCLLHNMYSSAEHHDTESSAAAACTCLDNALLLTHMVLEKWSIPVAAGWRRGRQAALLKRTPWVSLLRPVRPMNDVAAAR